MGRVDLAVASCFATVNRVEWKVRPKETRLGDDINLHALVCINCTAAGRAGAASARTNDARV